MNNKYLISDILLLFKNYSSLEIHELFKILKRNNILKVLIDLNHLLERRLLLFLRKKKIYTIVIQDAPKKNIRADILYNYNLDKNYIKKFYKTGKTFLGPKYLPINSKLKGYRKLIKFRKKIKNILVFFGGSDILNYTEKIFNLLNLKQNKYNINIVFGPGYKKKKFNNLKKKNKSSNTKLFYFVKNLDHKIFKSDVVICSGGFSMYKALYLKKTCIALPTSSHEKKIVNYASDQKLIFTDNIKNKNLLKLLSILEKKFKEREVVFKKISKIFNKNKIQNFYKTI